MPKTYGLNKSKNFRQSYYVDCLMGDDKDGYHIYADYDHDLKKWIVYCEDHEPSELAKMYPDTYKENGFNSLYDASVFIWEFVDYFYKCWEENKENDQDPVDTTEETQAMTTAKLDPNQCQVFENVVINGVTDHTRVIAGNPQECSHLFGNDHLFQELTELDNFGQECMLWALIEKLNEKCQPKGKRKAVYSVACFIP